MDNAILQKLEFKSYNLAEAKKAAYESAQHIMSRQKDVSIAERDILQDIAYRLLIKYYNGRELNLLTTEYIIAEAVDIVMERGQKIKEPLSLQIAIAKLAIALQKFFKAHDKED